MLLLSHPLRFLVVALAGWINEQQPEVIDYLQTENRVLREPQTPLTDLPPKDAILFDQIGERFPLPAIEPTGDGQEQEPKHRQIDHERQLISRSRQNGRNPVDREVGHYGRHSRGRSH